MMNIIVLDATTTVIVILLSYYCYTAAAFELVKTTWNLIQVTWTWLFLDWFDIHPNVLQKCSRHDRSSGKYSKKTRDGDATTNVFKIDCALLRLCDVIYIANFINKCIQKNTNDRNDPACAIHTLCVEQCRVPNAFVLKVFCDRLASCCPTLKSVTFHYLSGGSGNCCEIGNILVNNATLDELRLSYCFFTGDSGDDVTASASAATWNNTSAAEILGQGLAHNSTMKKIHLLRCGLQNRDLESIVAQRQETTFSSNTYCTRTTAVEYINLQGNEFSGEYGGQRLGMLIQKCYPNSLQQLVLADNPLGPLGARALAPYLVTSSRYINIVLVMLDLTGCHLGNQGIQNLIGPDDIVTADDDRSTTTSTTNQSVTTLILSNNVITGATGGQALGTMLRRVFVNVQTLDLRQNPLGTAGLYQLVITIQKEGQGHRRTFQYFNLNSCSLGNGSTTASAVGILPLEVHRVDVQQNCYNATTAMTEGDGGVSRTSGAAGSGEVLVQTIMSCFTNVQQLDLNNNHIGPAAAQKLATGLLHNGIPCHRIHCLDLSFCHLGSDGTKLLADSIATHDNVESLIMRGNDITSAVATRAITAMLERCQNMHKLDISDNKDMFNDNDNDDQSSLSAVEAFARALQQSSPAATKTSSSLRELILTCWDDCHGPVELKDQVQNILLSGFQNNSSLHVVNGDFNNENQLRLDSMLLRNHMITHVMESLNHATLATCRTTLLNTFLDIGSYNSSPHHNNNKVVVSASATFLLLCQHHANIIPITSSSFI